MAFLNYKNGSTSVIVRAFIKDSSKTDGSGLTGLTSATSNLIISIISDVESSPVTYTSAANHIQTIVSLGTYSSPVANRCRFKEVDSTNHPGLYELQFDDSRFSVSGANSLTITISGATNVMVTNVFIQLGESPSDITKWLGTAPSTPSIAGVPIVDVGYVSGITASPSSTPNVNVSTISNGIISSSTFTADTGLIPIRNGTAQTGSSSSITLDAGASSTTNFYAGLHILITGGTGIGQTRLCSSYDGSTKVASINPDWAINPDNTSTFSVLPNGYINGIYGDVSGSIGSLAVQAKTDVTNSTIEKTIDGSFTLNQITKLLASVLLGKISGAEGTTLTFRDISDTKNRIIAVVDSDGNRTTLTFDLS